MLVELGIDPNTADMSWRKVYNEERHRECYELQTLPYLANRNNVPAWSLSALIDMMPPTIRTKEGEAFSLMIIRREPVGEEKAWYEVEYGYREPASFGWLNEWYKITVGEDPISACVDMLCWLNERGFL